MTGGSAVVPAEPATGVGSGGYRPSDESAECYGCGERVPVTVLTERGNAFGIEYCRHERLVRGGEASHPPMASLDEGPVIERPARGSIVMGDDLGGDD